VGTLCNQSIEWPPGRAQLHGRHACKLCWLYQSQVRRLRWAPTYDANANCPAIQWDGQGYVRSVESDPGMQPEPATQLWRTQQPTTTLNAFHPSCSLAARLPIPCHISKHLQIGQKKTQSVAQCKPGPSRCPRALCPATLVRACAIATAKNNPRLSQAATRQACEAVTEGVEACTQTQGRFLPSPCASATCRW